MRTTIITALTLALSFGVAACDKKDEKKEDKKAEAKKDEKKADAKTDVKADAKQPAGDAKGEPEPAGDVKAEAPAEPAAAGAVDLTKLGLKAEAPAGSSAGDAIVGEGVMVQGPNLMVTVEVASDSRPKTVEDAKKEADMYTPQNWKEEKLADGFAVTFDNSGDLGANFFVNVRRDIGGKSYWCETTASSAEQQANALALCKSLKQ